MSNPFQDILNDAAAQAKKMDYSSNNDWTPDDGAYTCQLVDVATGTKEKGGVTCAWIRPTWKILDGGELEGRTFTDFMWINPADTGGKWGISLGTKQLLSLAYLLAGEAAEDLAVAFELIEWGKENNAVVEMTLKTSADSGRQNLFYNNLVSVDGDG